jgi:hypothetical protein
VFPSFERNTFRNAARESHNSPWNRFSTKKASLLWVSTKAHHAPRYAPYKMFDFRAINARLIKHLEFYPSKRKSKREEERKMITGDSRPRATGAEITIPQKIRTTRSVDDHHCLSFH